MFTLADTNTTARKSLTCRPTAAASAYKRVIRKKQPQQPQKKSAVKSGWGGALGIGSVANLGSFVELYEVQLAVVAMIYLDLVASTAQLLPYLQVAEDEAGEGTGGVDGLAMGSTGGGFGAFVVRLVSRLMQVTLYIDCDHRPQKTEYPACLHRTFCFRGLCCYTNDTSFRRGRLSTFEPFQQRIPFPPVLKTNYHSRSRDSPSSFSR